MAVHHVLGISGGKDSAALAVYMSINRPELDIRYFFTDTGKELPEVYDFFGNLEGFLGKPIEYLDSSITGFAPSITFCRLLRRAGARAS